MMNYLLSEYQQMQRLHPRKFLLFLLACASIGFSRQLNKRIPTAAIFCKLLLFSVIVNKMYNNFDIFAGLLGFSKMQQHRFRTIKVLDADKSCLAELKTSSQMPVFQIYTKDPHLQGIAIARGLYKQNIAMFNNYYNLLHTLMFGYHRIQCAYHRLINSTPPTIDAIYPSGVTSHISSTIKTLNFTVPEHFKQRIASFVKETNRLITEHNKKLFFKLEPISEDKVYQLIYTPDLFKMSACSAAIIKNKNILQLSRNLDWESLNHLAQFTLALILPSGHNSVNKPNNSLSITYPPGFACLSVANKNLVVTMNDATRQTTKRHHPTGYPQLILLQMIINNCLTIEEMKAFISTHPPATSHILTAIDDTSGAVFQLLPNDGSNKIFTVRSLINKHLHVTNHFFYENSTVVVPGSQSWSNSEERYNKMRQSLQKDKMGFDVLSAVNVRPTIHSLVFSRQQNELTLRIKTANYYAANRKNTCKKISISHLLK